MIKTFTVHGLKGIGDYSLTFNPDINILTGRNGSGKTTLLKLMWYMYSPNVERTIPEITFADAELVTTQFLLRIERKPGKTDDEIALTYQTPSQKPLSISVPAADFRDPVGLERIEEINRRIMALGTSSVFFPTFRRIEGGFSLEQSRRHHIYVHDTSDALSRAMAGYSAMMTVKSHLFIASISTNDVEELLTRQYASVSDQTNVLHTQLSQFITGTISRQESPTKGDQSEQEQLRAATRVLSSIRDRVAAVEQKRAELLKPFTVLSDMIRDIFKDKGIRISDSVTFGEAKAAIQASILSAGEKQMLSFLCYNAFNTKAPIFIDEPELSLHVDWQRLLFSKLLDQKTSNQFIVSTHSPFIYSRYPEKELPLQADRGES